MSNRKEAAIVIAHYDWQTCFVFGYIIKQGPIKRKDLLLAIRRLRPEIILEDRDLRAIKEQINSEDETILIGSSGQGYFEITTMEELERDQRPSMTQGKTILINCNKRRKKFRRLYPDRCGNLVLTGVK